MLQTRTYLLNQLLLKKRTRAYSIFYRTPASKWARFGEVKAENQLEALSKIMGAPAAKIRERKDGSQAVYYVKDGYDFYASEH